MRLNGRLAHHDRKLQNGLRDRILNKCVCTVCACVLGWKEVNYYTTTMLAIIL